MRWALAAAGWLVSGTFALQASAQCRPPKDSNEARLLAFYSVPISFSPAGAPEHLAPWTIRIGGEAGPVPDPDAEILQTGACFSQKSENTGLSPVFGRPRLTVGLPASFALEVSYLPPIRINAAEPNLVSGALSWIHRIRMQTTSDGTDVMLRLHGTTGRVRGPITCPAAGLQTINPTQPCFGTTQSVDTFEPTMMGAEGVVGTAAYDGRLGLYVGGGANFLRPRFRVGFTDGLGSVDNTEIETDLTRAVVFAGLTAQVSRTLDLSAQVYSVPKDATTLRVGAGYRISLR
ncbi:MAG: hypothetical protein WKF55_01885 [Gemmatimonadaceae bacterium]